MTRVYCISKCAEYQLSISLADPRNFSPLLVKSVRFLLTQTAFLSKSHECEVDGVSFIFEKSLKLLQSGIRAMEDMTQWKTDAIGVLKDTFLPTGGNRKSSNRDEKVIEALLSFTCSNAPKLLLQLVVSLVRVGGGDALQVDERWCVTHYA